MHIVSYRGPVAGGGVSSALSSLVVASKDASWSYVQESSLQINMAGSSFTYHAGEFPEDVLEGHYRYCNEFIWPVMHDMPERARYSSEDRKSYRQFNWLAVHKLYGETQGKRPYFVQDYQMALFPAILRTYIGTRTLLFWHIPWAKDILSIHAPAIREIARALLNADVIGFHTDEYAENFRRFVAEHMSDQTALIESGSPEVVVAPLGIDSDCWSDNSLNSKPSTVLGLESFNGQIIALSVDRMDYTKGVLERMKAIELFFQFHPEQRGKVTFVQVGERTRAGLFSYNEYWADCKKAASRVLSSWNNESWKPLIWIEKSLPPHDLACVYRRANLMLVNPIRDGLNLTAKEFSACQNKRDPGILLLSKGAGVWMELGNHAVELDPLSPMQMVESINDALAMSESERQCRSILTSTTLRENSLADWWNKFLVRAHRLMEGGLQHVR